MTQLPPAPQVLSQQFMCQVLYCSAKFISVIKVLCYPGAMMVSILAINHHGETPLNAAINHLAYCLCNGNQMIISFAFLSHTLQSRQYLAICGAVVRIGCERTAPAQEAEGEPHTRRRRAETVLSIISGYLFA